MSAASPFLEHLEHHINSFGNQFDATGGPAGPMSLDQPLYRNLTRLGLLLQEVWEGKGVGRLRGYLLDEVQVRRTAPVRPRQSSTVQDAERLFQGLAARTYLTVVLADEAGATEYARVVAQAIKGEVGQLLISHPQAQTSPAEFRRLDPTLQALDYVASSLRQREFQLRAEQTAAQLDDEAVILIRADEYAR